MFQAPTSVHPDMNSDVTSVVEGIRGACTYFSHACCKHEKFQGYQFSSRHRKVYIWHDSDRQGSTHFVELLTMYPTLFKLASLPTSWFRLSHNCIQAYRYITLIHNTHIMLPSACTLYIRWRNCVFAHYENALDSSSFYFLTDRM